MADTKPIPFIQPQDDGKGNVKLVINEEAAAWFSQIRGEVVVISVAGIYRTGKSYLLNRLFGKQKGFDIGATVQACTKGLWIWGKPAHSDDGTEKQVVLLDTEGLGDPKQADPTYDAIIFSLSILLASYFVYNSMGNINDQAIQQLNLVANLTERIKVRAGSGDNSEELDEHFPPFLWVVRDFSLLLEKNGVPISEKEYLEDCLALKAGASKQIQERNNVLKALRTFFKLRDCVTLSRPVESEESLQNLENIPLFQLTPKFREKMASLTTKILNSAPPKTVCGKNISGYMFINLARAYVKAINEKAVPTIHTAFNSVVLIECEDAKKSAILHYKTKMEEFVGKFRGNPIEVEELSSFHTTTLQQCIEMFVKRAVGDNDNAFQRALQDEIADYNNGVLVGGIYSVIWKNNENCSLLYSRKLLLDLHAKNIGPKLSQRAYFPPLGSGHTYQNDMQAVVQQFEVKKCGFKWKKAEALAQFLQEKRPEEEQLIADGAYIDEQNKEIAQKKMEVMNEVAKRKQVETQKANLHQQMVEQQATHLQHVEALQQQKQREFEMARKSHETMMTQRLQEQQACLQAGFDSESRKKQQQINDLQKTYQSIAASNQQQLSALNEQVSSLGTQLTQAKAQPVHHHQTHHHHGGCFSPNSIVKVKPQNSDKYSYKKIGEVCVGDLVEAVGEGGSIFFSDVYYRDIHHHDIVPMVEISVRTAEGEVLSVIMTEDHLMYPKILY